MRNATIRVTADRYPEYIDGQPAWVGEKKNGNIPKGPGKLGLIALVG
jgi:hypothetical protein